MWVQNQLPRSETLSGAEREAGWGRKCRLSDKCSAKAPEPAFLNYCQQQWLTIPVISNSNVSQCSRTGILQGNSCNTERTVSRLQTSVKHLQVYVDTNRTWAQSVFLYKKNVSEGMRLWQFAGMGEVDGSTRLRSPYSCGANTSAGTQFWGGEVM